MTEALEAVASKRGWIISDGKIGTEVQSRGDAWHAAAPVGWLGR